MDPSNAKTTDMQDIERYWSFEVNSAHIFKIPVTSVIPDDDKSLDITLAANILKDSPTILLMQAF